MTRPTNSPGSAEGILASRQVAIATRRASSSRMQLLSGPKSPVAGAIPPDDRFGPAGVVRPMVAYDAGLSPPPFPAGGPGKAIQDLDVDRCVQAVTGTIARAHYQERHARARQFRSVTRVLQWLAGFPGDTWEQRWLASGADSAPRGWVLAASADGDPLNRRMDLTNGAFGLIHARVIRPSYAWLLINKHGQLDRFLEINDPGMLTRLRALPAYDRALLRNQRDAEHCLARVMIRTGKNMSELRGEELLHYADVVRTSGRARREHLAWELLVDLGVFVGEPATLRAAWSAKGNTRQHTVAALVDRYGIPPSGVRDVLVEYLSEVKPGLDYSSLSALAYRLVRLFWWEVLQINPDQQDLRLSPQVATEWRERLGLTSDGRVRRETHSILFGIRALYRDLAEWAYDDPIRWGIWVAPCPVPRTQSRSAAKAKRRQKSTMQARTRAIAPLLPAFIAGAQERRDWGRRLLTTATATLPGKEFTVDGVRFARCESAIRYDCQRPSQLWADVLEVPAGARPIPRQRGKANITKLEEDSFWSWAVVECLRHTGIRIEELLELTQLSLRHHTPVSTNTMVPLLHIVPSKNDAERLIPMSPELVTVLVAVQRRAKGNHHQVPLTPRYDAHEKLHGEPLPHLFARRLGTRQEVLSASYVRQLLGLVADWMNFTDSGQRIRFTPHDFRRLFSTELVGSGLPLHIVAALLGHLSLDTTRGYTAVYPEQVIAAHQALIERRRQLRPDAEMRPATDAEWDEFDEHFLLRKVALGDCHRPYGTPCVHEHACTACRFLRVDPAQLGRIEEMTTNAENRLAEAREKVWLGEVAGLEHALTNLRRRKAEAQNRLDHHDTASGSNDRQAH